MPEHDPSPPRADRAARRPAAMCVGPGHVVIYGNPAFLAQFGRAAVGIPAREGLLGVPAEMFGLLDAVLSQGRPLARWIERPSGRWRLTAAPRCDPETGAVYGVAFHLRDAADLPVVGERR